MANTFFSRSRRLFEAISAACLLVLMIVVLVDVAGRNLLNRPLPWGTELLEVVLAAMIFMLYPVLALTSGHITVDLIKVRPSLQLVQRTLACIVGSVLFSVIALSVGRQAARSAGYGDATALLGIPTAGVLGGMCAFAVVTVLAFVVAMVMVLRGKKLAPHLPME